VHALKGILSQPLICSSLCPTAPAAFQLLQLFSSITIVYYLFLLISLLLIAKVQPCLSVGSPLALNVKAACPCALFPGSSSSMTGAPSHKKTQDTYYMIGLANFGEHERQSMASWIFKQRPANWFLLLLSIWPSKAQASYDILPM